MSVKDLLRSLHTVTSAWTITFGIMLMVVYLSATGDCNNETGKDCWGYYGYYKVRCDMHSECCSANAIPSLIGFGIFNGILQVGTGVLANMSRKRELFRLFAFLVSVVSFIVFIVGLCNVLSIDCDRAIDITDKSYSLVTGYSLLSLLVFFPSIGSTFGVWKWGFEDDGSTEHMTEYKI